MLSFDTIQGYLAIATPAIAWFSTVALIVAVASLIAVAAKRRGASTIRPTINRTDRRLFIAAALAGAIVYTALIVGSFSNLMDWAHSVLHWDHWARRAIVPLTLDGLGTASGFLAFRAIKRRTSPYLCYVMVWGATAASAAINATEGSEHGAVAAFYMAFLSLAVMVMFHLFLGQFQAGAEYVGTKYVRFGLRWVTYTWPTLLDFLCWVNHPPAEGTEPTVGNAVAHREAYRKRKQEAAHAAALVAARRAAELAAGGPEVAPEAEPAVEAEARPEATAVPERKQERKPRPEAKPNQTAVRVAAARRKHPDATQKEIAEKVRVSDRTVREYWAATAPTNVTPIREEATQ